MFRSLMNDWVFNQNNTGLIITMNSCWVGMMVRVFTNGPGDWGSIPGRVISKTQKNGN